VRVTSIRERFGFLSRTLGLGIEQIEQALYSNGSKTVA